MHGAIFEKVPLTEGKSFHWREFKARFKMPWHFHPEYELTHIVSGEGMRYVGDSVERFGPGDFVLLGPDLPHYWWQHADDVPGQAVVLQFTENAFGAGLWDLSEMRQIRSLLERAKQGVVFSLGDEQQSDTATQFRKLGSLEGWHRIHEVIALLGTLSETRDFRVLASHGFAPSLKVGDGTRMEAVCGYVNAAFGGGISHAEAARKAGLSPSAFSRFFRRRAGKTFEAYVNEVRIGHACRHLDDEDANVTEVAYRVGFNNLSNFNRRFRRIVGMAPRQYRAAHRRPG